MAAGTPILISSEADYDASTIGKNLSFLVKTSLMTDGADAAEAAVAALALPSGYYLAKLHSKMMKENPLWFQVDITQQVPPWPGDESDPLLRPASFNSNYNELTEGYFVDCDTPPKKVLNKANERFENFPQRRSNKSYIIMEITKNYSSLHTVAFDLLKHTQNADAVTIEGVTFDIETLLFLPVRTQKVIEVVGILKHTYYPHTFRLAADHLLFTDLIENRGYKQLNSAGKQVDIIVAGSRPNTPYPLDDDGHQKTNASDDPTAISFYPYADATWGIDFS